MKVNLLALCILISSQSLLFATSGHTQDLENTKIVLSLNNASLYEALMQIEQQSQFRFTYKRGMIEGYSRLNVPKGKRSVKAALDLLLRNTSITYEQVGHYIVLTEVPKDQSGMRKEDQFVAALTVSGEVADEGGEPLPGVNVLEKGSTNGTTTDVNGMYSLAVSDENAILVFSFIGYVSKEVAVNGTSVINVGLEPDIKSLEEVVVVGYGMQKKANLTGAVDQISSEALEGRPISNVGRGLQGVIPNLNVVNADGAPNSEPNLNIRGTTSINGGSPLVLVDGIQMNLNMLNPNDIESITVLKDAASAAIYGARGAFGVILVTLKDGAKAGRPVISYTGGVEFSKPTFLPDMLSSLEYMESTNIAQKRKNGNVTYSDQQLAWAKAYMEDPENNPVYHVQPNGSIFWHANVDNFKEMLQSWAPAQNHSVNVQGGDKKFSYYASLGYRDQEGMFRDATDVFKRYNGLINLSAQMTDWLKIGFKTNFTTTNYDQPHRYTGKGSSWWEQMTRGVPQILFPIKTPADAPIPNAPTEHFYNFLTAGGRNVTKTQLGVYSVDAEVKLTKGLSLKGDFSYSSTTRNRKDVRREFGYVRDKWEYQYGHTVPSFIEREQLQSNYFATNAYLTYNKTFAEDHDFSALVGFNQEWYNEQSFYVQGNNLISNDIPVLRLTTGETYKDDSEMDWAIRGVFMRFKYAYLNKYLLEMNGRYDGTSRFPSANRFQFFPSFSAGWIVSEEGFMDGTDNVLSFLKLRASYGSLGNQNVNSAYAYVSNFGVINNISYIMGNQLPLGLTPPGLVRPDLTWETASTIDFGVDATLWDKLDISFDWYKRVTSDMLVAGEKLPAVLGTGVPRRNGAELETKGIEVSLKWKDQLANGLMYDVGVVMSDYKAIITKYDNNPNKLWTTYYEGQVVGEIWGYETVGIFQTPDEVAAAPSHSQLAGVPREPGDIQYADLNGDGVINWGSNTVTNPGDKRIIGNETPRYQYGITGSLNWKGVDFRIFFQGVGKRDMYPTGSFFWGKINNGGAVGTREVYYNSWSEDNTDAYYPVYKNATGYNIEPQTRYLQNAAYIRLKNLTLGYTLPAGVVNKIGLQNIRLYASSENLWEASKLRGSFDPEVVSNGDSNFGQFYPLQRTFSFGVQVGL